MAAPAIFDLLRGVAGRRGTAIALRCGPSALSYDDFLREVRRACQALSGMGIAKGDCFAFLSENRLELMSAYYAAAGLGAVFVPINPSLTVREVEHIVVHSGAKLVFHDETLRAVAEEAVAQELRWPLAALVQDTPEWT